MTMFSSTSDNDGFVNDEDCDDDDDDDDDDDGNDDDNYRDAGCGETMPW